MVTYDEARSYAKTKNNRLLTSAEWDAAVATHGFTHSGGAVLEWIDFPEPSARSWSPKTTESRSDVGRLVRMARSAP